MLDTASNRIELQHIGLSFRVNDEQIELFNGLNLSVLQGHSYAITGPSGSGKSSLLALISGLESPSQGSGRYISQGKESSLAEMRSDIGFIFQQFHLLPELTALHNVALPLKLRGHKQAESVAKLWMDRVGLSHRYDHTPSQLSGGEQQRVAIARALTFDPKFIFADEPTGNLDGKSAKEIADILFDCCRERNAALVLVTHSEELATRAQYSLSLGAVKDSGKQSSGWEAKA